MIDTRRDTKTRHGASPAVARRSTARAPGRPGRTARPPGWPHLPDRCRRYRPSSRHPSLHRPCCPSFSSPPRLPRLPLLLRRVVVLLLARSVRDRGAPPELPAVPDDHGVTGRGPVHDLSGQRRGQRRLEDVQQLVLVQLLQGPRRVERRPHKGRPRVRRHQRLRRQPRRGRRHRHRRRIVYYCRYGGTVDFVGTRVVVFLVSVDDARDGGQQVEHRAALVDRHAAEGGRLLLLLPLSPALAPSLPLNTTTAV